MQGFELEALSGCEELLPRFRYVYVEASFIELYEGQALATEVIRHLLDRGFRLECVANLSYGRSPRPIQADFLFARSQPPADGSPRTIERAVIGRRSSEAEMDLLDDLTQEPTP